MLLEIRDLEISIDNKKIISGINLKINNGELHVIMGPNGSGKSTICYGLMGHPKYKTKGSIKIDGEELLGLAADARAKKGLLMAFQNPQQILGVNVTNLLRKAQAGDGSKDRLERMIKVNEEIKKGTHEFGLPEEFAKRDLNVGFSGGEKKRMELLQLKLLQPKLAILDEVEAGLDVDGVKLAAVEINKMRDGKRSFLMITHAPRILEYLKPDFVHLMLDGKIVKSGGSELAKEIEKNGYEQFKKHA